MSKQHPSALAFLLAAHVSVPFIPNVAKTHHPWGAKIHRGRGFKNVSKTPKNERREKNKNARASRKKNR